MEVDAPSSCLCYVLHEFSTCPSALPTLVSCFPVFWAIYPSMSPIYCCRAVLPPAPPSHLVSFLYLLSTCPLLFVSSLFTIQPSTFPSSFFLFYLLVLPLSPPLSLLPSHTYFRSLCLHAQHSRTQQHTYIHPPPTRVHAPTQYHTKKSLCTTIYNSHLHITLCKHHPPSHAHTQHVSFHHPHSHLCATFIPSPCVFQIVPLTTLRSVL
ncbi:hypothetical protein BKA57DRAFT_318906 [Linnemannia elongata]|nr:hypothetical protein BKA57DRAFT_318906 [Linnemannia elongata]